MAGPGIRFEAPPRMVRNVLCASGKALRYPEPDQMASSPFREQDYYRLFGLTPDATAAEIADAYRRLALRYHPDVAAEEASSPKMFKRIAEAYAVLSDPQQRRRYDRWRARKLQPPEFERAGISPFGKVNESSLDRSDHPDYPRTTPGDFEAEFDISPEEACYGGLFDLTVTTQTACYRCRGYGRNADAICFDCDGTGRLVNRWQLRIRLPGGVRDGYRIRLSQQRGIHQFGVENLLLRIKIRPCW